jgi:hypothetical protein
MPPAFRLFSPIIKSDTSLFTSFSSLMHLNTQKRGYFSSVRIVYISEGPSAEKDKKKRQDLMALPLLKSLVFR